MKTFNTVSYTAATLKMAYSAIMEYRNRILPENPDLEVVLLGRDCWPLYPMMLKEGIKVRYFIWSRITEREGAYETWLKEIAPGSLIVDTGFHGTIFDSIRNMEPTYIRHHFFLLSGNSDCFYPVFSQSSEWREWIIDLEHTPKMANRVRHYTEGGDARETRHCDDHKQCSKEETLEFTWQLCKALDIDESWATFTGLKFTDRNPDTWERREELNYNLAYRTVLTEGGEFNPYTLLQNSVAHEIAVAENESNSYDDADNSNLEFITYVWNEYRRTIKEMNRYEYRIMKFPYMRPEHVDHNTWAKTVHDEKRKHWIDIAGLRLKQARIALQLLKKLNMHKEIALMDTAIRALEAHVMWDKLDFNQYIGLSDIINFQE